ncbi:hypothetical protein MMC10_011143 [Thelotrema lepadinum]|nr:hypothetical protein [Thelotrema lepadinum]
MTPPSNVDEQSFKQMWIDARIRFQDLTKKSLTESTNRGLDDMLDLVETRFDMNDPDTGSKQKHIKELASNVLKFVQILGGIAAQGASMVFGPATLCFNAMSFLIDIPTKISKFHDDLARLFGEISTFMMRFKIYERIEQFAEIDIELKRGTHKLMIIFIDVCALSIDVMSGSRLKRLKTLGKIALFDNDSGVSEKLDEFKQLVAQQSQISDAVTLEHVLKSEYELTTSMKTVFATLREASEASTKHLEAKSEEIQDELRETHDDVKTLKVGTDTLVRDLFERSAQRDLSDHVEKICKRLSIGSDVYESPVKEVDQMQNNCLPNTGKWLKDIVVYQQWMDPISDAKPLLLLSGNNGVGKSYLISTVLDKLRRQYLSIDTSSLRISLACYTFKKNEKPSRETSNKDSQPSTTALKSIAAQIAKHDKVYAKNLALYLESKDQPFARDINAMELCRELLPPPKMGSTSNVAFFILLDGLDQLAPNEAAELLNALIAVEAVKTRVAIASTGEVLDDCLKQMGKESGYFPTIEVEEHNQEDVKKYVESEIRGTGVLQGKSDGLSRIVESMRQKIPSIVGGNFNSAKQIVERVSEAITEDRSEEEIDNLINKDSLRDQSEVVEQIITDYNASLNNQEIEQLNELLAWTLYGTWEVDTGEMSAALFMRTKREPLQSLEDKVKERYFRVLEIKDGAEIGFAPDLKILRLRNDDIENYLCNQKRGKREADAEANDDPTISMTIEIKNARLSKIQRFFWDLSEKVVIDKFSFADSLTNMGEMATISANRAEGNLLLARRCFDLLLDEPKEETEALRPYALENIMWHLIYLREEVNNGAIEVSERQEILANIVSLLQSADYVERHLNDDFLQDCCWLSEDGGSALQEWLRDSKATGRLSRKDLNWLKQATAGPNLGVLGGIATLVARHWLYDRKRSTEASFAWIDCFLNKVEYRSMLAQTLHSLEIYIEGKEDSKPKEVKSEQEPDASKEIVNIIDQYSEVTEAMPKDEDAQEDNAQDEDTQEEVTQDDDSQKDDAQDNDSQKDDAQDADASKELTIEARIQRGVEWAEHVLGTAERNSLWYERLGGTFFDEDEYDLAKKYYLKAKELQNCSWVVLSGLAKAYAETGDERMALQEMDIALTRLREVEELQEDEEAAFVENLQKAAKWEAKLGSISNAIEKLQEAIELDPDSPRIHHELLELLLEAERGSEASNSINEMTQQPAEDESLTRLEAMILDMLSWEDKDLLNSFATVFFATRNETMFHVIVESLEKLLARAREKNEISDLVDLLLCYGVALEHHCSTDLALKYWEECYEKGFQAHNPYKPESALFAANLVVTRHYSKAQSTSTNIEHLGTLSSNLRQLAERARSQPDFVEATRLLLANFYKLAGNQDMAQQVLLSSMKSALDILSDDDPENDFLGYFAMAQVLLIAGYKVDALSAASISGPEERYKETLEIDLQCDGCGDCIKSSDCYWQCCVCVNVGFDRKCIEKLQTGTLRCLLCSPNHEWLYVPSLDEGFKDAGKGYARMGGELQDGRRVGGDIVLVEEWVDSIREKWGIKKPEVDAKAEEIIQAL